MSPRFNWKEVESSSRSLRYRIITKSQILFNWSLVMQDRQEIISMEVSEKEVKVWYLKLKELI